MLKIKDFLIENWFRIAIFLTLIMFGLFGLEIYENVQKEQEFAQLLQKERELKQYISQRRAECLEIYKVEDDKWDNVEDWRYDYDLYDKCVIQYRNLDKKSQSVDYFNKYF